MTFLRFVRDSLVVMFRGPRHYWAWLGFLAVVIVLGLLAYADQLTQGLAISGMSDQVAWGTYIANFTFLVGVAAAAVMVVIPAYVFHRPEAKRVVMIAEGVAVAACSMCVLFVMVDLGRPERFWHLFSRLNFPGSILAWDVLVLLGYWVLNLTIPMYILYKRYKGETPNPRVYLPGVALSILWALSIHTVTAFLFSSNPGRPFWHTALLAPRFIASAFTAGPALLMVAFTAIGSVTRFRVQDETFRLLATITTIALQINLFMVAGEIFTEFYAPTHEGASAEYLFRGLGGDTRLVPYIWTALGIETFAVIVLMLHKLRHHVMWRNIACVLAVVGIWIEKGLGMVIPGFVPTPLNEVAGYQPSWTEIMVSLGIWAIGLLVFTLLAKASIALELGDLRAPGVSSSALDAPAAQAPVTDGSSQHA